MASAAKMDQAIRLPSDASDDGSTGSGGGSAPERRMLPMEIIDRDGSDDLTRGQGRETSVLTSAARAVASAVRRASTAVVSAAVGPASPTGSNLPLPATAPSQPCLHKKRVFLCVPCAIIGGVVLIICVLFKNKFTAAEVGLIDQQMIGTWNYGNKRYTISRAFPGALQFDEVTRSGRPVTGKLEQKDEFWQGDLKYTDDTDAGTIRLHLSPPLVSEFKGPGQDEWDDEWLAVRVHPFPEGGPHQHMIVGTWHYDHNQYTISQASPGALQFKENTRSGRVMTGKLEQKDKFWQGDLKYADNTDAGTIRLHLSLPLISEFKGPGQDEWDDELRADRVDPLPALQ